jgi:MFS family permease
MPTSGKRFYYGWLIVAAAGAAEFANAASAISVLTVFVNPMTQEFGWSRTQISGATSIGAILGAAVAPFTGQLVDRIGSRILLAVGCMVVGLACLYLSAVHTLLGFYLAFSLSRMADQGAIKIAASPAVGKWFLRYRGRAIALVFCAASVGIIVLAPMVQLVIDAWGWRAAWLVLAAVMFGLGVIPSALVVRRQPEDLGLAVDGLPQVEANHTRPMVGARPRLVGVPLPHSKGPEDGEPRWRLREAAATPTFWLVLVSLFAVSTASSGVGLHLVPHLTQQGLSPVEAVSAISVLSASGAVGALVLGFLAERFPVRVLMGLVYLLVAASTTVLTLADTVAETHLFAVLHGIASSGVNVLAPTLWASYYGRWSLGSIHGISRAFQVTGFAVGPLLAGLVYDATGSYQNAFVYLALVAAASSLLVFLARRPVKR